MAYPLPHATRNQVFTGLFNLLKTIPAPTGAPWQVFSQSLVSFDDIPAQPALYLHRGIQIAEQNKAYGVTRWQWRVWLFIYYRVEGFTPATDTSYPDQLTDQFLDNLEQLFQVEPNAGTFTLGGLVHHCWIDGSIFTENGLIDGQAFIIVPLSILV